MRACTHAHARAHTHTNNNNNNNNNKVFVNLTSSHLQILIFWHWKRVVPRPEVLLFMRKKASLVKEAYVWDMFKKASTMVVSSDPLSPTLINFFSYEYSRKHMIGPWCPWASREGDFNLEYACNQLFSPNIGALTKHFL